MVRYVRGYTYIEEGGRGGGTKEAEEAPQKADVPGIDEARGAPPLPRSPYLGRSTPNAADTAYGLGEEGWRGGREIDSRWDAEEGSGREEGLYGASRGNILRRSAN